MIDRLADALLALVFLAVTAFTFGVIGEAIDRGNGGGVVLGAVVAALAIGGVLFFGRSLTRRDPALTDERRTRHQLYPEPRLDSTHRPRRP